MGEGNGQIVHFPVREPWYPARICFSGCFGWVLDSCYCFDAKTPRERILREVRCGISRDHLPLRIGHDLDDGVAFHLGKKAFDFQRRDFVA